ncbi:hypothetical protein ACFYW6_37165 [Streptomyces sp. NPDC002659]|uniref:hypothetical protein n=1 Tax=Streptomyces sp. NPDC002659 TaxID=3364656 RepID=UPI0036B91A5C
MKRRRNPIRKFWMVLVTIPLLILGGGVTPAAADTPWYTAEITYHKVHFTKFNDCEYDGNSYPCVNNADVMGGLGVYSYSAWNANKTTNWLTTANWPRRWEAGGWQGRTKQYSGGDSLYPVSFVPSPSYPFHVGLCEANGYDLDKCYTTNDGQGNIVPVRIANFQTLQFYPGERIKFDLRAKWMDYDDTYADDTLCDVTAKWDLPASAGDYYGINGSGFNGDGQCDFTYTIKVRALA